MLELMPQVRAMRPQCATKSSDQRIPNERDGSGIAWPGVPREFLLGSVQRGAISGLIWDRRSVSGAIHRVA